MSVEASPSRSSRPFRPFFPVLVLGCAGLATAGIWNLLPDWQDIWLVLMTWMVTMLSGLLILGWWAVRVPLPWPVRLGVPLALVGLAFGLIEDVGFTADMVPVVHLRGSRPSLQNQATAATSNPVVPPSEKSDPRDAPAFRGIDRDGRVVGPALARDWSASPPRQIWRQSIGIGLGGFAVVGKLAVTLEQRDSDEAVAAYDTETGTLRWLHRYPASFTEAMGGPGPRSTPTIYGNRVVTVGAQGDLWCLNLADGKPIWGPIALLKDRSRENLPWAMTASPLIYPRADGRPVVVVNPGNQNDRAPGRAVVAFHLDDGTEAWASGNAWAGYSSPQLSTLDGKKQILLFDGDGLAGYDPETGAELWRHPWQTNQHINVAQPIVVGSDRVLVSSGYNVGCALLQVSQADGKWQVREVWRKNNQPLRLKMTSGVLRDGLVYGLDEGFLACMDPTTGEVRWRADRRGQYGHGQVLLSDDLLVILSEKGELALVEATPSAYHELGRIRVFRDKTWNIPTLVNGRAYLRNDREMACYDLSGPEK